MPIMEKVRAYRADRAEKRAQPEWDRWNDAADAGTQTGNPPKCPQYDAEVRACVRDYPEKSWEERQQDDHEAYCRERGILEGPGYTEPPYTWCGEKHDPDWTFTDWALERDFTTDEVEHVNAEYPEDRAEVDAMSQAKDAQRQPGQQEAAEAAQWEADCAEISPAGAGRPKAPAEREAGQ